MWHNNNKGDQQVKHDAFFEGILSHITMYCFNFNSFPIKFKLKEERLD